MTQKECQAFAQGKKFLLYLYLFIYLYIYFFYKSKVNEWHKLRICACKLKGMLATEAQQKSFLKRIHRIYFLKTTEQECAHGLNDSLHEVNYLS